VQQLCFLSWEDEDAAADRWKALRTAAEQRRMGEICGGGSCGGEEDGDRQQVTCGGGGRQTAKSRSRSASLPWCWSCLAVDGVHGERTTTTGDDTGRMRTSDSGLVF
jgi:hypothetical protein